MHDVEIHLARRQRSARARIEVHIFPRQKKTQELVKVCIVWWEITSERRSQLSHSGTTSNWEEYTPQHSVPEQELTIFLAFQLLMRSMSSCMRLPVSRCSFVSISTLLSYTPLPSLPSPLFARFVMLDVIKSNVVE
jgi:hypothetical protein